MSFRLLHIPIPVVHRFLFDTDPLVTLSIHLFLCLPWLLVPDTIVANAFAGNLELASHARTTAVCVSVSFVPVSPFDSNPV